MEWYWWVIIALGGISAVLVVAFIVVMRLFTRAGAAVAGAWLEGNFGKKRGQ